MFCRDTMVDIRSRSTDDVLAVRYRLSWESGPKTTKWASRVTATGTFPRREWNRAKYWHNLYIVLFFNCEFWVDI